MDIKIIVIEACGPKPYQERLETAIEQLQALNLSVEVSHAMCQAVKGIGYMYSAVVIGRRA